MPSTSIPRSQTGLVPTSNKLQNDQITSPTNYRKLPPRPPPEIFPYRGDSIVNLRYQKEKKESRQNSFRGLTTTQREKISLGKKSKKGNHLHSHVKTSSGVKMRKRERKPSNDKYNEINERCWDSYISEKEIHQFTEKEQQERQNSEYESLTYLRNSARHRIQLEELERKLEKEIDAETKFLEENSSISEKESLQSDREREEEILPSDKSKPSVLRELRDFKDSILRMCVDNDDSNSSSSRRLSVDVTKKYSSEECSVKNSTPNDPFLLNDSLSSQLDDKSCTGSITSNQQEKNIGSTITSTYCLHDIMSLKSNDMSLSEIDSVQDKMHSNDKDLLTLEQPSPSTIEISIDAGSEPSNQTLWDDLSEEQMKRIRRRMKQLCSSGAVDNKNTKTVPTSFSATSSLATLDCNKETNEKKCNSDHEAIIEQAGNPREHFPAIPCVSNIISQISEGLCTSIHMASNEARERNKPHNNCTGRSLEKSSSNESIPKPLSQPTHPFILPLASDVRESIERQITEKE